MAQFILSDTEIDTIYEALLTKKIEEEQEYLEDKRIGWSLCYVEARLKKINDLIDRLSPYVGD